MTLAAEAAKKEKTENHILMLLDSTEEHDRVYLLLELCANGDLLQQMHRQPTGRLSENAVAVCAKQLLTGLRTLHALGVIHRDIKPENLLCTNENIIKIADFGWCAEVRDAPAALAGTFQYMAPEVLKNEPQTEKADIWSLGVVLFELLTGRKMLTTNLGRGATGLTHDDPHGATAVKQERLIKEIISTCPPSYQTWPQDLSFLCWDFIRHFLLPDVNSRITAEAALHHPWLETFTLQMSTPAHEDASSLSLHKEEVGTGSQGAPNVEGQPLVTGSSGTAHVTTPPACTSGCSQSENVTALLAHIPTPMRAKALQQEAGSNSPCTRIQEDGQGLHQHQPARAAKGAACTTSTSPCRRSSPPPCQARVRCKSPNSSFTTTASPESVMHHLAKPRSADQHWHQSDQQQGRKQSAQQQQPQPQPQRQLQQQQQQQKRQHQKAPHPTAMNDPPKVQIGLQRTRRATLPKNYSCMRKTSRDPDEPDLLLQKLSDHRRKLADMLKDLVHVQKHGWS